MTDQDDNDQKKDLIEGHRTYYEYFDKVTNNGRVFIDDLSVAEVSINDLTPPEENSRNAYIAVHELLRSEYDRHNYVHPISTTKEEVLQQRIVAPCLASTNVSSRSAPNE